MSLDDLGQRICIVGPQRLQYELLSFCLENELGADCVFYNELPSVSSLGSDIGCPQVWLFDCSGLDPAVIEKQFGDPLRLRPKGFLAALFNVEQPARLNEFVIKSRIRGIFLKDDSRIVLLKGLRAIFEGQLWLSRKNLSEYILAQQKHLQPVSRCQETLSGREKDILLSVAAGSSNHEIAEELRISLHTIKAHLYKIYRKINVHNRLQATLWTNTFLNI